jgi:hypothetical protein
MDLTDFPIIANQDDTYIWDGDTYTFHSKGNGWYLNPHTPDDEITMNWGLDFYKELIPGRDKFVIRRVPTDQGLYNIRRDVLNKRDALLAELDKRYAEHNRQTRLNLPTTYNIENLDTYANTLMHIETQEGFPRTVEWPSLQ